jgi:hypothetical protein
MIDNNADQDEWTNSLTLGSKSVPDTDTGHEIRTGTKRSLDQLIELRIKELEAITNKESQHESWAESSQFQDHLLKKDQFVDDLFNLHHLPDQPGPVKPGFFQSQ